jgi:osmotically-inducible protein OsmY
MGDGQSKIAGSMVLRSATLFWVMILAGCSLFHSSPAKLDGTRDQAIEVQIRAAVAGDPDLDPPEFQVRSTQGIVELTGQVQSIAIKSRVGLVAAATAGVVQVRNDLRVQPQAKP